MAKGIAQTLPFLKEGEILKLPSTRYQGSKNKLIPWICDLLSRFDFDTVVDGFGGSGVVGYALKRLGKRVTYNDYLEFNYYIGLSLVENNQETLSDVDINAITARAGDRVYSDFIARTFGAIYYNDEENEWLDIVVQNISTIPDKYKKAVALNALFQSALVKRPFNLFHRKNLYIREAEVDRNFGNKTTWDKPFAEHFRNYANEINGLVIDNGRDNVSLCLDILEVPGQYDLVYLDPPYTSSKGVSVDYLDFYHFLEGIRRYNDWGSYIDEGSKHKKFANRYNIWNDKNEVSKAFDLAFRKFRDSIIAVSYRNDGIPSIEEISADLRKYKKNVEVHFSSNYKYVLSKIPTKETLIIGY